MPTTSVAKGNFLQTTKSVVKFFLQLLERIYFPPLDKISYFSKNCFHYYIVCQVKWSTTSTAVMPLGIVNGLQSGRFGNKDYHYISQDVKNSNKKEIQHYYQAEKNLAFLSNLLSNFNTVFKMNCCLVYIKLLLQIQWKEHHYLYMQEHGCYFVIIVIRKVDPQAEKEAGIFIGESSIKVIYRRRDSGKAQLIQSLNCYDFF